MIGVWDKFEGEDRVVATSPFSKNISLELCPRNSFPNRFSLAFRTAKWFASFTLSQPGKASSLRPTIRFSSVVSFGGP